MNKIIIISILILFQFPSAGQQLLLRNIDEYGALVDFHALQLFLDTAETTNFDEVRISINDSVIFRNNSIFSTTRLQMKSSNELLLTLKTTVPKDTSWEWIDILIVEISSDGQGKFTIQTYPNGDHLKPSKQKINQVLQKRLEMISNPSYTTEDWNQISKREYEEVVRLSGDLFHCAFYGNVECEKHFESLQKEFNVMYAGYLAGKYESYQNILKIKNTVPNTK